MDDLVCDDLACAAALCEFEQIATSCALSGEEHASVTANTQKTLM